MKFQIVKDWFELSLMLLKGGLPSLAILLVGFNTQMFIVIATGCIGLLLVALFFYFELQNHVEISNETLIVHKALTAQQIPLKDITMLTREETFKTTLQKGLIVRDATTTAIGETKIVLQEEKQFIEYLLQQAPHIEKNL